jgi:hypothetical protein
VLPPLEGLYLNVHIIPAYLTPPWLSSVQENNCVRERLFGKMDEKRLHSATLYCLLTRQQSSPVITSTRVQISLQRAIQIEFCLAIEVESRDFVANLHFACSTSRKWGEETKKSNCPSKSIN